MDEDKIKVLQRNEVVGLVYRLYWKELDGSPFVYLQDLDNEDEILICPHDVAELGEIFEKFMQNNKME